MACCRPRTAAILLLLTAVPLALLATLELSPSPASYRYRSHGWMRECAKWDAPRRRFLVSTFSDGGVAEIKVDAADGAGLEERAIISDPDVQGNASLGIAIDGERGRVLVVYADALGRRYGALGAYDLLTGERRFLVQLSGPGDFVPEDFRGRGEKGDVEINIAGDCVHEVIHASRDGNLARAREGGPQPGPALSRPGPQGPSAGPARPGPHNMRVTRGPEFQTHSSARSPARPSNA